MVSAEFELATLEVKKITGETSNDDLLQLYAYYKIATGEDFSKATAPGTFDFKGKAKYKAWQKEAEAGLSPEEAEKKYIALTETLKTKYGFDSKATKSANGKDIPASDLKKFDELVQQLGRSY